MSEEDYDEKELFEYLGVEAGDNMQLGQYRIVKKLKELEKRLEKLENE